MENLAFLILESNKENYFNLITLILSIIYFYPSCNIVLHVSEKTREKIENFPYNFNVKIEYVQTNHNSGDSINEILRKLYELLDYGISNYEECILIKDLSLMVNKIGELGVNIKKQGFAFVKLFYCTHLQEHENRSYLFELVYLNNRNFLEKLKTVVLENYNVKINSICENENERKISKNEYLNLPFLLLKKYNINIFLPMATYVASEDFCSFKHQLKIGQITNDFYSDQIKRNISVLNIRANVITDAFLELNKLLFKKFVPVRVNVACTVS